MEEKEIVLKRARNAVIARDFDLALRLYNTLLQTDSENPALLSDIGNLYIKAGDDRKAAAYFSMIIELDPDNEEALNAMGGICRRIKEYDEAIEYLNRALQICKDRASIEYNLGFTYKSMGKNAEAIECFQSVIADNPTDVLAYNHLGAIYANQKEYDKAVSAYRLGLQVDPNHPILQFNLARAYESTGNDAEAIASYEAALRAKPGWKDAVKGYAKLLLKRRRTADAAELIQNAVVLHPEQADLHYLLGRTFLQQDNYAKAEENLEKASALAPDSAKILSSMAEAYENDGRAEEALNAALKAEKTDADNIDLKAQTVRTLLSAKKYAAACERLKSLQTKIPNDARFLDLGGQYSICVNHPERSKAFYARLEAVDSSYTKHLLNAAKRFRQTGLLDDAARYIDSFIEKNGKNAGARLLAGKIAEERGMTDAALENYEAAARIDAANFAAKENTARVRSAIETERIRQQKEALEASDRENFDKYVIEMQQPEEPLEQEEEAAPPQPAEEEAPLDFDIPADESGNVLDFPEPEQSADDAFNEQMLEDEDDVREQPEPEDDGIFADAEEESAAENEQAEAADDFTENESESDEAETQHIGDTAEAGVEAGAVPEQDESDFAASEDEEIQSASNAADKNDDEETAAPEEPSVSENETLASENRAREEDAPAREDDSVSTDTEDSAPQNEEDVSGNGEAEDFALPEEDDASMSDGENIWDGDAGIPLAADALSRDENDAENADDKTEIPAEPAVSIPLEPKNTDFTPTAAPVNAAPQIAVPAYNMNVKAQLADEDAKRLEQTLAEVAANAEKAVDAAEKAWNAAQHAADAAQSADAAHQYIKEMAENEDLHAESRSGQEADGEKPSDENADSAPSYSEFMEEVSKALPIIGRILENKDDAKKYEREIALFEKLRAIGDVLPEEQKQAFLCSRARLLLDYLISKLSGKPGLLVTSNALRKTDVLSSMISDISEDTDELDGKALVSKVFADLRKLLPYLPDQTLSQSLRNESDKVVDKL
ncbi:MAG: tetratricopeptide repeat protein [Treponema sp.]